jgi:hypothetical protein
MSLRLQYLPELHAGKYVGDVMQRHYLDMSGLWRTKRLWKPVKMIFYPEEKIMSDKIISIEEQDGPFQMTFQRIMRMVPDKDKEDKKLQRLIAFRLKIDGEATISEYLIKKIKAAIKCSYRGNLYDYLKDDLLEKTCVGDELKDPPPGAA